MKCIIISNGNINDYQYARKIIKEHDFIICADGGSRHLLKMSIFPNLIVGDLDSIDEITKQYYMDKKVSFIQFSINKDYTDTELAIEYAIRNGATRITLMGVIGNRMDHTLANITLLLPLIDKGIEAKIIDEHNEIIATRCSVVINGEPGELLSIIPLSETVEDVSLVGLEYPLNNYTIKIGSSIGVSNRFVDHMAKIFFRSGTVLIIKSRD